MSKKLKPLTIFLSDDELVNFKSHFDEFLNMNCDDKIKEQQEEIERLNNIIKETIDFGESMEYCGQEDYFYDLKAKDECGNDNTFDDSKHKLLEILNKVSDKE